MRAIIAAAGTGGHINPGLAIANKIMEKEKDSSIIFIGTNRGLETDLVPRSGYSLKTINAHGLERKITIQNIKNLFETYKSIKKLNSPNKFKKWVITILINKCNRIYRRKYKNYVSIDEYNLDYVKTNNIIDI